MRVEGRGRVRKPFHDPKKASQSAGSQSLKVVVESPAGWCEESAFEAGDVHCAASEMLKRKKNET